MSKNAANKSKVQCGIKNGKSWLIGDPRFWNTETATNPVPYEKYPFRNPSFIMNLFIFGYIALPNIAKLRYPANVLASWPDLGVPFFVRIHDLDGLHRMKAAWNYSIQSLYDVMVMAPSVIKTGISRNGGSHQSTSSLPLSNFEWFRFVWKNGIAQNLMFLKINLIKMASFYWQYTWVWSWWTTQCFIIFPPHISISRPPKKRNPCPALVKKQRPSPRHPAA